jgi:hypothetical protein
MVQRDPPGLGQHQPPAAPLEQVVPHGGLQRAQLRRQGRGRQVQPPRRAGQRALKRHGAEQAQVMQVQVGHAIILSARTIKRKTCHFLSQSSRFIQLHPSRHRSPAMDIVLDFLATLAAQFQRPTLAFLIGGMLLAALGSKLEIPEQVYKWIVVVLLLKIGLGAGIAVREADIADLILPALVAGALGVGIVLLGRFVLVRIAGVPVDDGMATAGLFGAVSASTLAAGMMALDETGTAYEAWLPALYPFMDIPALIVAIVLAHLARQKTEARDVVVVGGGAAALGGAPGGRARPPILGAIVTDSLRSPAISAMLLGLALGLFARPDPVYAGFYEPLFRGLLSLLMLIMGMEAWARLADLRKVAHVYAVYALVMPVVHGALGFAAGWALHVATGFSPGGAVLLAVMAASSSDISGPPTLRAALPRANQAAYVGASTGIGTPVAMLSIPLWLALAEVLMG